MAYLIRSCNISAFHSLFENDSEAISTIRYNIPITFKGNISHNLTQYAVPLRNSGASISLEITPLHLAIICNSHDIVKCILDEFMSKKIDKAVVQKALTAKTKVVFKKKNAQEYPKDAYSLNGWNVLHLASKFSSRCLKDLLHFVHEKDVISSIQDMLDEKDANDGKTPLHVAASVPDTSVVR